MKVLILSSIAIAALAMSCANHEARHAAYPYHNPLSSPGSKFGGLPPAAQNSIRAEVGGAEIYDIRKSTRSGRVVYEVLFPRPDLYPPLYLEADGTVLNPDLTVAVAAEQNTIGAVSGGAVSGVKFGDLPNNVANTIHEKAPTAEVSYIRKISVGDSIFFEVWLKDNGVTPRMLIADDGTLVKTGK